MKHDPVLPNVIREDLERIDAFLKAGEFRSALTYMYLYAERGHRGPWQDLPEDSWTPTRPPRDEVERACRFADTSFGRVRVSRACAKIVRENRAKKGLLQEALQGWEDWILEWVWSL